MFDYAPLFSIPSHLDGYLFEQAAGNWWSNDSIFSPWDHYSISDVVGTPTIGLDQTTAFTCAVVSQQMILHSFGIEVSEAQLVYDATNNGWLTENGTSIHDMGKLLEKYGVSTHINFNGDLTSMINDLAHGHKIIVPINSDELWNGVSSWQKWFGWHNTGADHAIVVTGVDFSNPNNPRVIVNDPGVPGVATQAYPLQHFLEAWNDSNYTYLATETAPANLAQHTIFGSQFNADTGIYNTPEFWVDIAVRIAGVAIATIVMDLCFSDYGQPQFDTYYSPWDAMTDAAINQLFLTI